MIELLLQAERALGMGALDQAERLYWQAIDADSQNAIAIVGLAKVARHRGDDRTAIAFGRRALKVDAENAVARRLVAELEAAHPAEAAHAAETTPPADAAPADTKHPAGAAPADTKHPAEAAPATPAAVDATPAMPAVEKAPSAPPAAHAATSKRDGAGEPAVSGDAGATDPGAKRGGRTDLEWPAADLQQVRQPRDR